MVGNATFNNISVISWQAVLLVTETDVPGENLRPATFHSLTNFITYCCVEYTLPEWYVGVQHVFEVCQKKNGKIYGDIKIPHSQNISKIL